jgi:hypothetical protein
MKARLIIVLAALFTALPAAAQTDMYDEYITPETRAIMERFEEAERHAQEAQAAASAQRTLALVACILIGLVPLCYIGRDIVKKQSWKDNPGGTAKAIAVGIAGGAVMFGLSYGVILLKIKMGDSFNFLFAILLIAAILGGALYVLKK